MAAITIKINKVVYAGAGILAAVLIFIYLYNPFTQPIRVGILHSLTGTIAVSAKPVVDATLMAINEINANGGVLGRQIKPIIFDGKSDWPTFAKGAEYLITQQHVSVIFGCWTSASRKTVKPIIEKHNHLLIYPTQYEGLEESKNIIYIGAAPNQQIVPGVFWAFHNLGKKFFLVGSDSIAPHVSNAIIKAQVAELGGEIVGEEYILFGRKDVGPIIEKIKQARPTVILNTINGDTNIAFFRELRRQGIRAATTPTVSFSIAEQELRQIDINDIIGDYSVWNYFQSINTPRNAEFIVNFEKAFPQTGVIDGPMEEAYFGVYLWANAVKEAGTPQPQEVLKAIRNQSIHAPEGIVYIDSSNNHTWKFARIGKIRFDKQFSIVWDSKKQIKPEPFIPFKTKPEWEALIDSLYKGWGNKWSK